MFIINYRSITCSNKNGINYGSHTETRTKDGGRIDKRRPLLRSIIALLKWKGFDALDLAASLKDDDVQLPSFLPTLFSRPFVDLVDLRGRGNLLKNLLEVSFLFFVPNISTICRYQVV